jgi:enoyl-CoA hydratase/carnithine racemase
MEAKRQKIGNRLRVNFQTVSKSQEVREGECVSEAEILFEREGPVAVVTFNRPEFRNAMTWAMYDGLVDACETVDADADIRVLIVRGAGGKAFVAGTDISQFRAFSTPDDAIEYERRLERVLRRVEAVNKPTIAAIEGVAVGGGAALALACDLRYCTPDSRMGVPIARTLGNCLSVAIHARLLDMLGPARTKEILFRARLVGADEALQAGLVNEIVPAERLHGYVREVAEEIAGHAPITLQVTKEAVRRLQMYRRAVPDGELGEDLIVRAYMSEDFREGVSAFLDKRTPVWRGK